jgi:phosphoglycerol transferase
MAVGGFSWLRATNRYSIVILCAVLLWLGRACKFRHRPALGSLICIGLAGFTVWESSFAWPRNRRLPQADLVKADRVFVQELEKQLPHEAAVFQVPVMAFPESPPILGLLDYDPFRPYVWSKTLRFSYGTHKGRPREAWQAQCARKPARDMVGELVAKGFAAILVHRPGFADRGRALEAALSSAGLSRIAGGPDTEMVSYRLQ